MEPNDGINRILTAPNIAKDKRILSLLKKVFEKTTSNISKNIIITSRDCLGIF